MAVAEEAALKELLNRAADQEIEAEIQQLQNRVQQEKISLKVAQTACGLGIFGIKIPSCGRLPIPRELAVLFNGKGQLDFNKVEARKQEIITQKQAEYDTENRELGHEQELESDEYSLIYMTRAGFDPAGSLRAMEILTRQPVPNPENLLTLLQLIALIYSRSRSLNNREAAFKLREPLIFDVIQSLWGSLFSGWSIIAYQFKVCV